MVRVGSVVDNVQLALLVVVTVPPVHHSVLVSLLVSELPVVSHPSVVAKPVAVRPALTMDLEGDFLWLRVTLLQ